MRLTTLHQPINETLKDWLAAGAISLGGLAYGQDIPEPKPIIQKDTAITGLATYYTEESCKREGTSGVYTANGEKFDEKALTCAMRSRAWGTKFKVTNVSGANLDDLFIFTRRYYPPVAA